jgi:hypothetical protein
MDRLKLLLIKLFDLADSLALLSLSWYLVQIKEIVGTIAFMVTISYTMWKWIKEYSDHKNNKLIKKNTDEKPLG